MKETHGQAVKRGKKSRASGADFERRVRKDLEDKGWIVAKWTNNVEFEQHYDEIGSCGICWDSREVKRVPTIKEGKLIPSKHKFRGMGIPMAIGTGFPDFIAYFIAFKHTARHGEIIGSERKIEELYEVIGVEVKSNGYLKPEEKEKCKWLIENKIFSKILIASKHKIKNRIHIEYEEWK